MLVQILANTPTWVWGLLAALLALGASQLFTRSASLLRVMILPAAMTGLSLYGTLSVFGAAPAGLLAWCAAAGMAVPLVLRRPLPARTRYDAATRRFSLPGSGLPLLLILGIFFTKYVVGVMLAMRPALAGDAGFAPAVAALYGAFSGVFIGRALRLWRLAKQPQRVRVRSDDDRISLPRLLGGLAAGALALVVLVLAGLIAFGAADPPPPLAAVTRAFRAADYSGLPPLERYAARDGAPLAFRAYRAGAGDRVAVLIHGSSGDSHAMHTVGRALSASGITAYALDMRGHGASGRRGDIDYTGQLDDDLADFAAVLRGTHPGARLTLIGHSSGGGFALRTAGGGNRELFDAYLLLAPLLHQSAPTARPDAGGWVKVFVPRIIGLNILDRLGLPWFQHLPVLAFALPPEAAAKTTATYSYRLQLSFRPHEDYLADVRGISRPTRLLVGAEDELFVAERYAPLLEPLQSQLRVKVLPGITHVGIVMEAAALQAIVAEL